MRQFEIRPYGKSELAMLYFPRTGTAKGALNCLKFWIRGNASLRRELQACGMPPRSKSYTPKEVAIIVRYLGEP